MTYDIALNQDGTWEVDLRLTSAKDVYDAIQSCIDSAYEQDVELEYTKVNGCPVIWQGSGFKVAAHPTGFMLYKGFRLGTYKTCAGAIRRAEALLERGV